MSFPFHHLQALIVPWLGFLSLTSQSFAAITHQTVALNNQAAPGTAGNFKNFDDTPTINNQGKILFGAQAIDFVRSGIWLGTPGSINVAAFDSGTAPVVDGQYDYFDSDPQGMMLKHNGTILFGAHLKGGTTNSTNDFAIFVGQLGALQVLYRKGDIAPGGDGAKFLAPDDPADSSYRIMLRESGVAAFGAALDTPPTALNDQTGVWSGTVGNMQLVARAGQSTPYGALQAVRPTLFAVGETGTAFFEPYTGSYGVFTALNNRLFAQGDPAPGTTVNFTTGAGRAFGSLQVFPGDRFFFNQELQGAGVTTQNRLGYFSGPLASISLLTRSGTSLPNVGGAKIAVLQNVRFNAQDAFLGTITLLIEGSTTTANDSVLVYGAPGATPDEWLPVVREGENVPELAGVTFVPFLGDLATCFNDNGLVAFNATFAGTGIDSNNDTSFWVWDPNTSTKTMVLRENTPISIGPGVTKAPRIILFRGGIGPNGGDSHGLNDQGQLAFKLVFTDNTSGVIRTNLNGVPFEQWVVDQGLTASEDDLLDDPNQDGLTNLAAYFLGVPARASMGYRLPEIEKVSPTQVVLRVKSPLYVTGVSATTEVSPTLATDSWEPGPALVEVGTAGGDRILEAVLPMDNSAKFARVLITK